MKIEISKMDHSGSGIGYVNDKITFIPKTIIGDICDIEITKSHKNYNYGKVSQIIKNSDIRIKPKCPYYYECGGCNISNLNYDMQLEFKKNKVINIFKRYLNIDINPKIIDSNDEYKYRNKITYNKEDNYLGLVDIDNKIIEIDKCLLVSDKVNKLYNKIKKEDLSKVKKIIIRECDNGYILSVDGIMNFDNLKEYFLSIYLNNIPVYKKEEGYINIGDIKYRVSDKSFFQINTKSIEKLYNLIIKYGNFSKNDKVIDLYCGVGSISIYISKYVNSVLGIEIIPKAIDDAKENAKINNIDNVKFICGDVAKLIDKNISGDVLIVDPPRTGLDTYTCSIINNSKIKKLIYVSCDPMTLVRDIKNLDKYEFKDITLVDMFPQTHHIESVILLQRKS